MAKKLVGLSGVLTNLEGTNLQDGPKPVTARMALATMITRASSADPVRMMEIAHRLWHEEDKDGGMEVDDADIDALKSTVLADKLYTNLVKGPILSIIQNTENPLPVLAPSEKKPSRKK